MPLNCTLKWLIVCDFHLIQRKKIQWRSYVLTIERLPKKVLEWKKLWSILGRGEFMNLYLIYLDIHSTHKHTNTVLPLGIKVGVHGGWRQNGTCFYISLCTFWILNHVNVNIQNLKNKIHMEKQSTKLATTILKNQGEKGTSLTQISRLGRTNL